MNISCSLSINMNLARRESTFLTSATLANSFATCLFSSVIGAAIRIVTPLFFAFSSDGNKTSNFRVSPSAVVTSVIVFCASLTSMSKWLWIFCRPFSAPDRSVGSMNLIPSVNRVFSSPRTSLPFSFSSLFDFSFAVTTRFFFTRSITSSGFSATNLIGLPSFITMNPFFSKDSRISYVRERGTSDIDDSSPAVDVPLDRSAVQTFTSYRLRSNIFRSLLKNSSLTIMVISVLNSI